MTECMLVPVDPADEVYAAGNEASLSTSALMDDTRYSCIRYAWAAMLGEIKRSNGASPWRPIESAPKDGTDILVYRPTHDGCYIPIVGTDCFLNGRWWRSNNETQPTLWMPLPPAPIEGGERKE